MLQSIKNLKKYRFLLVELIKKDIKLKYRRSYMGYVWTMLEPLLTMLVLCFVFSKLYGKSDPFFPVYVLTGRLLYTFFNNATKAAMKSIRSNGAMIKKVYVPKYIYPVSTICSNFIIFLFSLLILVIVSIVLKVPFTIYVFASIIPLILLFIMSLGIGLILATMAVFFRDLEYLWSVALMLIMYMSAIFYDIKKVIETGYEWVFHFNPLYLIILNFRKCILDGQPFDKTALITSALFSLGSLLLGLFLFYRNQDKFILNI